MWEELIMVTAGVQIQLRKYIPLTKRISELYKKLLDGLYLKQKYNMIVYHSLDVVAVFSYYSGSFISTW